MPPVIGYSERPMEEQGITLGIILEHLRAMESRIRERFENVEFRLDRVELGQQRLERNLTAQIDAIDKRLDPVEIEHLPKRVTRLEKHCGLAQVA